MASKSDFKEFVSKNPEFASYVSSGKTTWQKMFEMYDLYGENNKIWEEYRTVKSNASRISNLNFKEIINGLKGVNLDSLQENLSSLQKAVGFLEELSFKPKSEEKKKKKQKKGEPETITRFFDD